MSTKFSEMKLKHKIIFKFFDIMRTSNIHRLYNTKKSPKLTSDFKLVYFCGAEGINYLNASLVSIHKYWNTLPEILIISDGTPLEKIQSQLVPWPKKVDLISWKEAADHFRNTGNKDLADYAQNELWGKKYVSILYCAAQFPLLYSDTDILWFADPQKKLPLTHPVLKMGNDILHCYSNEMLEALNLTALNNQAPLNAGLIFANGDFSAYPGWVSICKYLKEKADFRTEQTSFAILNKYFNPEDFFSLDEVLIKINDEYSFQFTRKAHKHILARHYVNMKSTTFWRDFMYMLAKK
ncbi:hypothetical protein QWZ08_17700 [Ferruginibacter paludis]|uniref:hypothetical protein n=1 Tax=Ferruginibacter paludis TaxID=1310417 RepID=UPI0025B2941D|nr:hypothetical protein [Ferruginibacter paludis]MDN3657492.1 hypothetical protein [Ferruginibacter paludis]